MPDFYGLYGKSPRLGLEEGQQRQTCPPGTSKVYLQDFPWEKCVPDNELTTPASYAEPPVEVYEGPPPEPEVILPPEPVPVPEPAPAPPPPAPTPEPEYEPPGKARFLDVDEATGEVLDPDTGEPLPVDSLLALSAVETIAAGVGILVGTGLVLTALGIFSGGK